MRSICASRVVPFGSCRELDVVRTHPASPSLFTGPTKLITNSFAGSS